MLVLHALWDDTGDGQLHLWIERPPRARTNTDHHHPGARGHASLVRAIGAWLGENLAARARRGRLTLHLPTHDGAPMASPELGLAEPDATGVQWQPWIIPTLSPRNPSIALRRLAHVKLPEQIALGASARFWLAASALVDDLISRDCFAPYAGDADQTLLARWSPVYDAEASAQLRTLAAAMPGVCRAIIPVDAVAEQHRPPDAMPLLAHFIERVLDRRARRARRGHQLHRALAAPIGRPGAQRVLTSALARRSPVWRKAARLAGAIPRAARSARPFVCAVGRAI